MIQARKAWGASLARSGAGVGRLSPDPLSVAARRTSEETETVKTGVITAAHSQETVLQRR